MSVSGVGVAVGVPPPRSGTPFPFAYSSTPTDCTAAAVCMRPSLLDWPPRSAEPDSLARALAQFSPAPRVHQTAVGRPGGPWSAPITADRAPSNTPLPPRGVPSTAGGGSDMVRCEPKQRPRPPGIRGVPRDVKCCLKLKS